MSANAEATISNRLVGDPIDVVTGANTEITRDLLLTGPIPLDWRRYYDSSFCNRSFPLGWGHTHGYDLQLHFDTDGLRLIGPGVREIGFPPLVKDGDQIGLNGIIIQRVSMHVYRVFERECPVAQFEFDDHWLPAPVKQLRQGQSTIVFHYDSDKKLVQITDSQHRDLRVEFTQDLQIAGLLLINSNAKQNRWLVRYKYDSRGNLVEGTDVYNHRFHYEYDSHNRIVKKTDQRGYSFIYTYDGTGKCIHSIGEDGLQETKLEYYPDERKTVVTKSDGGDWIYYYDDYGVILQINDPMGGVCTFVKGESGRIEQEVDAGGSVLNWKYDNNGALLGKADKEGYLIAPVKDLDGPALNEHRIPQCPLEYEYGKIIEQKFLKTRELQKLQRTDPKLSKSLLDEDHESGRHNDSPLQIDRDGFMRDSFGTIVRILDQTGAFTRVSHDKNGNIVRFVDRDGSAWNYEYASWNLLVAKRDPLGSTSRYDYTKAERLRKVIDPGGTVSKGLYDKKGRLVEIQRHERTKEKYTYDLADRMITKTDGDGKVLLTLEYTPNGFPSLRQLSSGENHYFEYDPQNRLLTASTDQLKVNFSYDAFGNRIQDVRDDMGVKHRFRGPEIQETILFERFAITYKKTRKGTLVVRLGNRECFRIIATQQAKFARSFPDGTSEYADFNAEGRCVFKSVERLKRPSLLWKRYFIYSPAGDLLEERDSNHGITRYEYDANHRLKRRILPDQSQDEYRFDVAGNLLQQPDLQNVVISGGNRLTAANGNIFEYNNRDEICLRKEINKTTIYHNDSCGNLTQIEQQDFPWTAEYDPLGRRTQVSCSGAKTTYYWDTDRLAAELHHDGNLRLYVYADSLAMVPMMVVDYDHLDQDPLSGKHYYIFTNHLGVPVYVMDEQGECVWQARIDPYGKAHIRKNSTFHMPIRFPGHYLDEETGLHYNRFRYYSPELGRYIQPDPIDLEGGLNLYAYTENPLTQVDVRGLSCPIAKPGTRREWDTDDLRRSADWIRAKGQSTTSLTNATWAERQGLQRPLTPRQQQLMTALDHSMDLQPGQIITRNRRTPLQGAISSEDLRNLTAHTGCEHGVVRDQDGNHFITRGTDNNPGERSSDQVLVHSHPRDTPPSSGDRSNVGDNHGAVVGHDGRTTDYDSIGPNPNASSSYVGPDGTIDGSEHAL